MESSSSMIDKIIILLLPALLCIGAASCGAGKRNSGFSTEQARPEIKSAQEIGDINSKLIPNGSDSSLSPADYIIGPSDLIEIRVFESARLTTAARVSSRGQITLHLLGGIQVEGLTARDAEIKIETLLRDGGYINDPHVSVFISEYRSKLVSVVGQVRAPGKFELRGQQNLLDVLASAQGLTDRAGRSVYLTRTEENGRRQSYVVYIEDVLLKSDSEANLALKPNDVIYVPEAGAIYLEGAVRRPGALAIRDGVTTLSEALATAGGISSVADSSDVKLVRHLGAGKREVMELNLKEIRNGNAEDPIMKDRDTVIVGTSAAKRILTGLRLNYLYGLLGIGYSPPEVIFSGN